MNSDGAGITILTYHSISDGPGPLRIPPAAFREHLAVLAEAGCVVMPLADVAACVRGMRPMPRRGIVITFDDAYVDFATVAFPSLRVRGWPCTLFVPAGRVGTHSAWPGVHAGDARALLDWPALTDLAADGVDVGSHGVTHLDLTRLSATRAAGEIAESRRVLEQHLARPVSAFAFPYGRSTASLRAVAAHWYRVAVGTTMRRVAPDIDVHALPRVDMHYFRGPERLRRFVERGSSTYFTVRRLLRRTGQAVRG